MISLQDSIPVKNDNYRIAEEIFYLQFNDISFFVEDEDQENFYFCILTNLFPDIKIEKIFPLNGKENVINESLINIANKKKVFIVDKDFDDLLNKIVVSPNLFYLERYSIENFLFEKEAIVDYIVSEKPRLRKADINRDFDLDSSLNIIGNSLNSLIHLHLIVQNKCPNLKNVSLNHERFFTFNAGTFDLRADQIQLYSDNIQLEFASFDRRLKISTQLKKAKKLVDITTVENYLKHMPGKYLIKMLKQFVESLYGLVSRNVDSFCYRIAEKCKFDDLNQLKLQIENFIQ